MPPSFHRSFRLLPCVLTGLLLVVFGTPPARADEIMRSVQEELRKRNLYFGEVDGLLSPQVAAALRRYQQRKGFQPTGEPDAVTLRSLSLPLPPSIAAVPTISPPAQVEPAPVATTTLPVSLASSTPWPDLPVLRSDEARVNPTPSDEEVAAAEPDPTPKPKPPPAAALAHRWPNQEAVQGFIAAFLAKGESNVPGAQGDFFADRVNYFNEGTVDRRFIDRDTDRYNKRWPERHFGLASPLTVEPSPDGDPDKCVVNFECKVNVSKPGHDVKGTADESYTLQRTGPESLRIVAIKEERVRKN